MSHFASIKTSIRDPKILKAALEAQGITQVEVHEKPQALAGYQAGFKADVIVRKANVNAEWADIGWQRQPDGTFTFLHDDMDYKFNQAWQDRINQEYSLQLAIAVQAEQGYEVMQREALPDGSIRLVMQQATMY